MKLLRDSRVQLIVILYSIAYSLLVLNFGGVYWDDWTLVNQIGDQWALPHIENGTWPLVYPLHKILLSIGNEIFPYRVFIYISFLVNSIVFLKILDCCSPNKSRNLILAIISAVIPLNTARITMMCIFYTASCLMYAVFFYLYTFKRENLVLKILSYGLLFYSFFTNSFLVFHYAFILITFELKKPIRNISTIFFHFKHNIIVCLMPILFFIYKKIYLKPYGLYANYNEVSIKSLLSGIPLSINSFLLSIGNILKSLESNLLLYIILFFIVSLLLRNFNLKGIFEKFDKKFLLLGLFLTLASFYPYAVAEKFPKGLAVDSRYELQTSYGSAILIFALAAFIYKRTQGFINEKTIFTVIITSFIATNISIYATFIKYWFETEALSTLMKESEVIKNNTSFMITRNTFSPNAGVEMTFHFYEINGISKKTFGNTKRLFSPQRNIAHYPFPNGVVPKEYNQRAAYSMMQYNPRQYQYHINFIQTENIPIRKMIECYFFELLSVFEDTKTRIYKKYYKLIFQPVQKPL